MGRLWSIEREGELAFDDIEEVRPTLRGAVQEQVVRRGDLKSINRIGQNVSTFQPSRRKRTAMVFSLGCQLACKIFLLKSRVSSCIASLRPPGRAAPFLTPFLAPGGGPPIFLALKADLSACRTTSPSVSESYIRK